MAANCRGHAKAGKQQVARSSGLLERSVLQNSRNKKMKTSFNMSNLRAQTGGFKMQTLWRKTLVALHLAVGSSREWVQSAYRRIPHNFCFGPNSIEDFLKTSVPGLGSLPQVLDEPIEINLHHLNLERKLLNLLNLTLNQLIINQLTS